MSYLSLKLFNSVITGLLLFTISANSSADDLFAILKRMSDADHNQNYQGTFILRKSDKLSTLKVTHGVDEKGDWENLQSLSGESKNIFRRNKQVVSVYPEREIVTVRYTDEERSLHPQLPDNFDQLELFYTMQRLEDDRIANHSAIVVDLLPKDQYRYGYRYWVDKNTGMLLRCDLYDENKSVIEQMMFTSLEYMKVPPTEMFDMKKFDRFEQQNIEQGTAEFSGEKVYWAVNTLPQGFMLTQSKMRNTRPGKQEPPQPSTAESVAAMADAPVEKVMEADDLLHMVYSDGLASVSVFIEKNRGAESHLNGAASMGAVNAFGQSINGYFVTVVGEVPATTVQVMAQSTVKLP
jgi:sigma-E factor negative regulatory protein RseB